MLQAGEGSPYLIDPEGRRIGRRVSGTLDKGWLYLDKLRPAAQLNGAGQLEAIFVYGTRSNVPDYIIEKTGGGDVLYRVIADHLGTPRPKCKRRAVPSKQSSGGSAEASPLP